MKYYAVCDVIGDSIGNYKLSLREEMITTRSGEERFTLPIFNSELDALRECNEINASIDPAFKCVVEEIEIEV